MAGQYFKEDSAVLAGSAFALGLVTGLVANSLAKEVRAFVRNRAWHRGNEETVTYDENLPDSLARREPSPESGQPRYGGTGALGVHPAVAESARPSVSSRARDR